jgi:hypothetical protein
MAAARAAAASQQSQWVMVTAGRGRARGCPWCLQLRRRFGLFLDAFWKTSSPQSPKLARVPCPHLVIGRRSFCSASPLLPQNPPAPGVIAPLPRCIAAAPTRAPLPAPQQLHSSSPLHLPLPRRCPLPLPLFLLALLFVSCCLAPSLRLGPRSSIPAIPAPLANPTSKSATDPSPPPSQCPSLPTTPMRYLPSTAKS